MVTICHKILIYVVFSAPKPVVNIDIYNFETGIFEVSASVWQIVRYQPLVLLAKQSKHELQVGDLILTLTVQDYLKTVINVLAITYQVPGGSSNDRGRKSVLLWNARLFTRI